MTKRKQVKPVKAEKTDYAALIYPVFTTEHKKRSDSETENQLAPTSNPVKLQTTKLIPRALCKFSFLVLFILLEFNVF